jgi:hypothetical protein
LTVPRAFTFVPAGAPEFFRHVPSVDFVPEDLPRGEVEEVEGSARSLNGRPKAGEGDQADKVD